MITKQKRKGLNLQQFEQKLTTKYKGKTCSFSYPTYETVYGLVDEISVDITKDPEVVIQMKDKRYTCSPESIYECLKVL